MLFDELFGVDFKKPYHLPSLKSLVPSTLSVKMLSPVYGSTGFDNNLMSLIDSTTLINLTSFTGLDFDPF